MNPRTVPSLALKVNGSDVHVREANQCYEGQLNTGLNMVRDGSVEMHGGVCECIFTYTLARLYIGPCSPYIDDKNGRRSHKSR